MKVTATGHRPPQQFLKAKRGLNAFLKLSHTNISEGISGMADGWDTIFALACLHYGVPLHCYVPFKNQKPTSEHYEDILNKAVKVTYCAETYHKRVFLDRDDAMVRDGDLFLAFLSPDSKKGGTFYTVNRALDLKKPVINFWS